MANVFLLRFIEALRQDRITDASNCVKEVSTKDLKEFNDAFVYCSVLLNIEPDLFEEFTSILCDNAAKRISYPSYDELISPHSMHCV